MERNTSLERARRIMGSNFIGPDELVQISEIIPLKIPDDPPEIPYTISFIESVKNDYILLLGTPTTIYNTSLNLLFLRETFGTNPDISEPCFYNQDWYLKERFMSKTLDSKWYLLRKHIFEDSRAVSPNLLINNYLFPSAILCGYTFFVYWLTHGQSLWKNDYVWCSDFDQNGDRIYVGRYTDTNGINKNGFSIHRHLTLRNCYGCLSTY
jgi:hypothetical protein